MQFAAWSLAFSSIKAVSTIVNNFNKLKKLSNLPTEVAEDAFYLTNTLESLKPILELANLLHIRHLTCKNMVSSVSLARRILLECKQFLDSIGFDDDFDFDDDTDLEEELEHETAADHRNNYNAPSMTDDLCSSLETDFDRQLCITNATATAVASATTATSAVVQLPTHSRQLSMNPSQMKVNEYLSAPSNRDRLILLLRRLQLVCETLNLSINACSFVLHPNHINIYHYSFGFNAHAFHVALEIIRKFEFGGREFNTSTIGELLVMNCEFYKWINLRKTGNNSKMKMQPILQPLFMDNAQCFLTLEAKQKSNLFVCYLTVVNCVPEHHSQQKQLTLNSDCVEESDSNSDSDSDSDSDSAKSPHSESVLEDNCQISDDMFKFELNVLQFRNFHRYDDIFGSNHDNGNGDGDDDDDDDDEDDDDNDGDTGANMNWKNDEMPDGSLSYCWDYNFPDNKKQQQQQSFVVTFEPLNSLYLTNIPHPISAEVFEFLIALCLIRSKFLIIEKNTNTDVTARTLSEDETPKIQNANLDANNNSTVKNIVGNRNILEQFASTATLIKECKEILGFSDTTKCTK